MTRWRSTATTWTRKTTALLLREHENARNADEAWLAGYDAAQFVSDLVDAADELVRIIPADHQLADVEQAAKALHASLRHHRLAAALDDPSGRTPEEAETFRAKAAELRSR